MNTLLSCIYFYSFLNQVDPRITQAVIQTESSGNPFALGKLGDSGLMQIRHKYVPQTQMQLFQSCTNVKIGTELLRKAMLSCKHKANYTWLSCYNLGNAGAAKLKHPRKWPYVRKIVSKL